MKQAEAFEILGVEPGEATPDTIKAAFRRACMNYHPDRGGSTEMMQAVNAAYAMVKDFAGMVDTSGAQSGYGEALNEAINAIITCPGLVIEVCGIWVWVSGDTRTHKETLKAASYRWASKKHQWYFRPEGWSGGRGKSTMDDIRAKYGSSTVKTKFATALDDN